MSTETASFSRSLPRASSFAAALEEERHTPLPDDWLIAVTDVVRSRDAIAAGRYKAVNMAGVAILSAAMNALASNEIPYVFGGDGAALAIAPQEEATLREVLARTATMAREELELELRAALVPVSRIRADGHDVRVQAVRVSDTVDNYAFSGGGVSHAERLMKAGEYRIAEAPAGERPNLEGLSCRWTPLEPQGRRIVSIIVEPGAEATAESFRAVAHELLTLLGQDGEAGSPVPAGGPAVQWPVDGVTLEARATRGARSLAAMRRNLQLQTFIAFLLFRTGIRVGGFDPRRYQRITGLNTDFRKVQDGVRMTVSLTPDEIGQTERFLEEARGRRQVRYGLCVQDKAVLTCYVPSIMDDSHFHFLDGAGGGYAGAAARMRD